MNFKLFISSIFTLSISMNGYAEIPRFVKQIQLPDNRSTIQVAEGDHEPRSIGSYAIRLYGGANPDFPLDDFITGQIHPRDGAVERLINTDLNGDGVGEVVVIMRSTGSGGYLSADVFSWQNKTLKRIQSISDLGPKDDPVAELKQLARKK